MDPKNLKDMAGRLQKGGKGAGIGLSFLAAAGGVAYGLYQSMYTGEFWGRDRHHMSSCLITSTVCLANLKLFLWMFKFSF